MENLLIDIICYMSPEQENAFYNTLRSKGFTETEITAIHANVFFRKMEDASFRKEVKSFICEKIYEELNKGEPKK